MEVEMEMEMEMEMERGKVKEIGEYGGGAASGAWRAGRGAASRRGVGRRRE